MRRIRFAICVLYFISTFSWANVGAGFVLGEPTGLSLRVDQSESRAIDAAVAWRLGDGGYLSIHADYLFIQPKNLVLDKLVLDWYFGAGALLGLADGSSAFGLRVPLGVSYKFPDPQLEIFTELAPGFLVAPETSFEMFGGLGLRYWF